MKTQIILIALCCLLSRSFADMKGDILRVTQGADVKLIYGKSPGGDKQWSYHFKTLMQYDTKTDELKELVPDIGSWHSSPQACGRYNYISPDGQKVVFSVCVTGPKSNPIEGWIVDWNDPASRRKVHDDCYILCVGRDPATGKSWAYFGPEYGEGKKPLKRFNIDNPSEVEEVNIGGNGVGHFLGVSADCKIVLGGMNGGPEGKGAVMCWVEDDSCVNMGAGAGPVGTCNIGFSPDDEANVYWIGNANMIGPGGGAHSALAVNKLNPSTGTYDQSTRKDFLFPNFPDITTETSVNSVICTQWAYDTDHCRVGTYVAYHSCGDRCGNLEGRGSILRFNDALDAIEDWAQWSPDGIGDFTESRPHMWMYQDGVNTSKQGLNNSISSNMGIELNSTTHTITFGNNNRYKVLLSTPDGRVVDKRSINRAGTYRFGSDRAHRGIYILSIHRQGNLVTSERFVY